MGYLIRRVAEMAAGASNFTFNNKPAPALSVVLRSTPGQAVAGLLNSVLRVAAATTSGSSVVTSATGTAKPANNVAPALSSALATQGSTVSIPAADVVQVVYSLVHTIGSNAAVSTQVTGAAWTNTTNAQGLPNGTLSSHPGNALSAQDATLTFNFPDFVGKSELTITQVLVRFHYSQTTTVAANGNLQLKHGAAGTVLATDTGDADFIAAGRQFDLTASYPTFASLDAFQAAVRHESAMTELHVGNVDAVVLEVRATRTDIL